MRLRGGYSMCLWGLVLVLSGCRCNSSDESKSSPTDTPPQDARARPGKRALKPKPAADTSTCRDRVVVEVAYPRAAAAQVEALVLEPLEGAVAKLPGVGDIHGFALTGRARLAVEPERPGQPALDQLRIAITRAVSKVRGLPADARLPTVMVERHTQLFAIVVLFESSDHTRVERRGRLRAFEHSPIFQRVEVIGDVQPWTSFGVNPDKLVAHGVRVSELIEAVKNTPLAAGANRQAMVAATKQGLRTIVLKRRPDGTVVRLGDVGWSTSGINPSMFARYRRWEAIVLRVVANPGVKPAEFADTLRTIAKYPGRQSFVSAPHRVDSCAYPATPLVRGGLAVLRVKPVRQHEYGFGSYLPRIEPTLMLEHGSTVGYVGTGKEVVEFAKSTSSAIALVDGLRKKVTRHPKFDVVDAVPAPARVVVRLRHGDLAELEKRAAHVKRLLGGSGVRFVSRYPSAPRASFQFKPDAARIASVGLTPHGVLRALRLTGAGDDITSYRELNVVRPVRIRFTRPGQFYFNSIDQLRTLPLVAPKGTVTMGQLGSLTETTEPAFLYHHNRQRGLLVTAAVGSVAAAQRLRQQLTRQLAGKLRRRSFDVLVQRPR